MREHKDQTSALISHISHQIKTPVANLQLYAQLLLEQPVTPHRKDCATAISAKADKTFLTVPSQPLAVVLPLFGALGIFIPVLTCRAASAIPWWIVCGRRKQKIKTTRRTGGFDSSYHCYWPSWQNFCSITATWALVASPWGLRVVGVMPPMTPCSTHQAIAWAAQSLMLAASA